MQVDEGRGAEARRQALCPAMRAITVMIARMAILSD